MRMSRLVCTAALGAGLALTSQAMAADALRIGAMPVGSGWYVAASTLEKTLKPVLQGRSRRVAVGGEPGVQRVECGPAVVVEAEQLTRVGERPVGAGTPGANVDAGGCAGAEGVHPNRGRAVGGELTAPDGAGAAALTLPVLGRVARAAPQRKQHRAELERPLGVDELGAVACWWCGRHDRHDLTLAWARSVRSG